MNIQSLEQHGYTVYPRSVRSAGGTTIFVARRGPEKLLGLASTPLGDAVALCELTWKQYEALRTLIPVAPVTCDRPASFGTGDRLGMVTAAHLDAVGMSQVFPVIAQQSPRELQKTGRTFRGVLLDAVMGALEVGYAGPFGADADHIKDEAQLMEAVRAGYSMYTLDLSGFPSALSDESDLSELSRGIVRRCAGLRVGDREASEQELTRSALVYQPALENVTRFHEGIRSEIPAFDLEISIDEGTKETSVEDHLFVAEYLHGTGIDFTSLAPKFPGKFRKGIDYIGDLGALKSSIEMHASLARTIGGYKLSLHSGSDKWSVYGLFTEATEGTFHVKTSGTSWLEAMTFISQTHKPLFRELHRIALDNLNESVKAYDTEINVNDFPAELPADTFISRSDANMRQLWHISYGALLAEKGGAIRSLLLEHEERHYEWVSRHIREHLECLAW